MIVTLPLNPSLDYTIRLDELRPGVLNRAKAEDLHPGGKGINVSRVLHGLGHESRALGFTAGFTGAEIERQLAQDGLMTGFVRTAGLSRINVKVKAGKFTMGATEEQGSDAEEKEKPAHKVSLTKDYYIGQTEVTQALWQAVLGSNPSYFKDDNLPVENVSWEDCQRFIFELNSLTGSKFRLPTEAEWEYAARGGNKSRGYKYSGSNSNDHVAWYYENSGNNRLDDNKWKYDDITTNNCRTHPVGTKSSNELGIFDMSGNVWEWCNDWFGNYSSSTQTNPTGPSTGSYRVCRGGSLNNIAKVCRVSSRLTPSPHNRNKDLGLRLVLGAPIE